MRQADASFSKGSTAGSEAGPAGVPDAEDVRLAQCLADILRAEDPEAFVPEGIDVGSQRIAVDGHWLLPSVIKRLRREMRND